MKEIIGKAIHINKSSFRKLNIDNKIKTGEDQIVNKFNKYFVNVGSSLAKNIAYRCHLSLSINELK